MSEKTQMAKNLESRLQEASCLMDRRVKFEDVAIFLGPTKAGKSTLLNYLIGNKLIGEKEHRCRPITIKKGDDNNGPEIGRDSASQTTVPVRWTNPNLFPELALWDAPGNNDLRGEIQDIENGFYIYKLFTHVKSVKIVLVIDIIDIAGGNIDPFINLLDSIENLFKDKMKQLYPSIAIIFSKTPKEIDDNEVNKDYIKELFQYQILESQNIKIGNDSKDFIKYLMENDQNIGFFKKATCGLITPTIDQGIVEAINNTRSIQSDNIKDVITPNIAHKSQKFLYDIRKELYSMEKFGKLQTSIKNIFMSKFNNNWKHISHDLLHEKTGEYIYIKNQINKKILYSDSSYYTKITALQSLDPNIESIIKKYELIEKSKLMEFVDRLLGLKESKEFETNLQQTMVLIVSKMNENVIKIKLKLKEISEEEAKEKIKDIESDFESRIKVLESELTTLRNSNEETAIKKGFFIRAGHFLDKLFRIL